MSRSPDDGEERRRAVGDAETVRDVFDGMPARLIGVEGPEHRVVAVDALGRSTGSGAPYWVGRPLGELFCGVLGQRLRHLLDRAAATGAPQEGYEWPAGPGGPFFDLTATPRRAPDGAVTGHALLWVDATARVREREAARARLAEAECERARAAEELDSLRQALLPADLPVLPRLRTAARSVPGSAAADGPEAVVAGEVGAGEAGGGERACGKGGSGASPGGWCGDWFDAVPLPGGAVGLVVGDAGSYGPVASVVMGQLRTVVRERLRDGAGAAEVLRAASRYAAQARGARAATACVVVVDPVTGHFTHATAGHPPPLRVAADGTARTLRPAAPHGPLGTGAADSTGLAGEGTLAEGEVLVLYSDGLVARPGVTPAQGTAELATAVGESLGACAGLRDGVYEGALDVPERVVGRSVEQLTRTTGHADDVTLLAAQRTPPVPGLEVVLPAERAGIRAAGLELGQWLVRLGVRPQDESALQHAVGELLTNAVEHGYAEHGYGKHGYGEDGDRGGEGEGGEHDEGDESGRGAGRGRHGEGDGGHGGGKGGHGGGEGDRSGGGGGGGEGAGAGPPEVTLRARITDDGCAEVSVSDRGRWREPRGGTDRGHGLAMAGMFSDDLRIERGHPDPGGTTVTLRRRVRRPVGRVPSGRRRRVGVCGDGGLTVEERPDAPGWVRVSGTVDATTADRFDAGLRRASRNGTRSVTVDLTGVRRLAGAGVTVLHRLRAQSAAHARTLTVYVPEGAPATTALELVSLPYTTRRPPPGGGDVPPPGAGVRG
ncbi:SpoIIE family protein phosphatase [Streptomyces albus subsp. chlorinus]|uniref:SpoIIE family protein phosphatase n=1 Tax=Streptomyces albus TaxID=1888 RepID=UPI00156EE060|nr:SpoIIE family protein phosphatase [Streptomyces albus]NSC23125.1 SpoIIE family protein phosphatase [Streptomyces albus subsp. chlorinus]